MRNKILIRLLLTGIFVAIVWIVLHKKNKSDTNPFEYDIEAYKDIDESLISHKETKQISIKEGNPRAINYKNNQIYLLTEEYLQIIEPDGSEVFRMALPEAPNCLSIQENGNILVGFKNFIVKYSGTGDVLKISDTIAGKALLTAITYTDSSIFVADAGNRQVLIFTHELNNKGFFKGESGVNNKHGFIIPSAHFDLAVDNNELWVVNPGLHTLQNYTETGKLRAFWSKPSFELDGFSGCCNPFYIAFLSDGSFVTSEKGLVRIKIHKPSGEFVSVAAAPHSFTNGTKAPALAVDENDNIIALDFDRKMIRFFSKN